MGERAEAAINATPDQMAQALQLAWDDYTIDTGNHPDCLEAQARDGGYVMHANFAIGNFAEMVAGWLAVVMERGNGSEGSRS